MCRSAATLQVLVDRVVEELIEAQNTGLRIIDYSLPEGDPSRIFFLKLILLLAVGDYPAQGKLTNFLHCGVRPCHWCNMDFPWYLPGHNVNSNHRSILALHHWMREHVDFGERTHADNTQYMRTHAQALHDAQLSEACSLPTAHRKHPRYQTGVDGICSFSLLDLFDMVYDVLPDIMHIDAGIFKARLVQLMKGECYPKRPAMLGKTYKLNGEDILYSKAEMVLRESKNKLWAARFAAATKVPFCFFVAIYARCDVIDTAVCPITLLQCTLLRSGH